MKKIITHANLQNYREKDVFRNRNTTHVGASEQKIISLKMAFGL